MSSPSSIEAREAGSASRAAALLAAAEAILPWMVEIRRDLHRHPELGLEEHRTNAKVRAHLDALSIPYQSGIGGTGIVAQISGETWRGREDGPAVALRADLDALPLVDQKDVPYRSVHPGKMHACGHDVHTAILLGAARLLTQGGNGLPAARALPGTIKLLFQPAEETVGGAQLLIEAGALRQPDVSAIFGLHVDPGLPVGEVGVRYGQRNASSDDLKITIHGRSAHGAYPSGGIDGIVVAAQVITALQSVVSRNVDARDAAVVTLGTIEGGTQQNILANRVHMSGTVRCLEPWTRDRVLARVRAVAEGVAEAMGASAEVEIAPSYDPLINHDSAVDLVRGNAVEMLGAEAVTVFPRPNMGVEDFAFYLSQVPGAFYSLGVRNEERGIVHEVHHELFDVDEYCLAVGAALQAYNAVRALGQQDPAEA